jgi:hypothetical protein
MHASSFVCERINENQQVAMIAFNRLIPLNGPTTAVGVQASACCEQPEGWTPTQVLAGLMTEPERRDRRSPERFEDALCERGDPRSDRHGSVERPAITSEAAALKFKLRLAVDSLKAGLQRVMPLGSSIRGLRIQTAECGGR